MDDNSGVEMNKVMDGEVYRQITQVLAVYGFEPPQKIYIPAHGILNTSWLVVTPGRRLFVKRYRYRDNARINAEHTVLRALAGYPAPVPHLYLLPDQASVLDLEGVLYAVWDWATGRYEPRPIRTPEQAQAFGESLGRLHALLQALPVPFELVDRYLAWDSAELRQQLDRLKAIAQADRAGEPFAAQTLEHIREVEACIAEGLVPVDHFGWLPLQIIHADPSPENIYFDPAGQIAAIFDWELVSVRPRIWDLIRAINYLLPDPNEPGGALLDLAAPVVAGYHAVNPLSEAEVAAMPDLYYLARVHDLWVYEEHYLRDHTRTDVLAPHRLAELRWYHRRRDRLRDALLAGLKSVGRGQE